MHDVLATVGVALLAFVGTMVDNFVAFASQLAVSDRARHDRAAAGQFIGIVALVLTSVAIAVALGEVPLRWIGVLAAVPLALAVHGWRSRSHANAPVRRGMITTMLLTFAFGGDNLAVWIPIFRAGGISRGVQTTVVFLIADLMLIAVARWVASHPRVVAFGQRTGPLATPVLYVILSMVIVWQCHWF